MKAVNSGLGFTTLLLALAFGMSTSASVVADPAGAMTKEMQDAITPALALQMLKDGNKRFVEDRMLNRDYAAKVKNTTAGQYPFAAIVGCIDSRVPPAIIFDRGVGDLFVGRVAGNFVNDDTLGGLEFATKLSGAKIVVVLGHTECGAVKGACDGVEMGLLTATLANINPAVNAVQGKFEPRSSKNPAFVHAVTVKNVELTMQKLRDRSNIMRKMIDSGEISLVGAMYDVSNGQVTFLE